MINTAANGRGPLIPKSRVKHGNSFRCNAPGRGLGPRPTSDVPAQYRNLDGFFWIGNPGRSAGRCAQHGRRAADRRLLARLRARADPKRGLPHHVAIRARKRGRKLHSRLRRVGPGYGSGHASPIGARAARRARRARCRCCAAPRARGERDRAALQRRPSASREGDGAATITVERSVASGRGEVRYAIWQHSAVETRLHARQRPARLRRRPGDRVLPTCRSSTTPTSRAARRSPSASTAPTRRDSTRRRARR